MVSPTDDVRGGGEEVILVKEHLGISVSGHQPGRCSRVRREPPLENMVDVGDEGASAVTAAQ